MGVEIECSACGHVHTIPERTFDPDSGTTACPECGERPFTVCRGRLRWHPERVGPD